MSARPLDLTNISNMCTKAEVTGSQDFSFLATAADTSPTFAAVRTIFIKTLPPDCGSTWKNKKTFPRYSFPIVAEPLKSFPVTTGSQTSCSLLTLFKNMWVGGGVWDHRPPSLRPHTRECCWGRWPRAPTVCKAILSFPKGSWGARETGEQWLDT